LNPVMNSTKWEELRLAMYELGELSPRWRVLDLEQEKPTAWDGDWFYHFRNGQYKYRQWVEIEIKSDEQYEAVFKKLAQIRVPGEEFETGFRIFGYAKLGEFVDFIG